jgi:cytochrome c556
MKWFFSSVAVVALVAVTAVSSAHEGATGVAKDRMDLMQGMSKDMKEITRRVNANRDLTAIGDIATHIHDAAPHIAGLFPVGSGTGITDAKPEIWQDWNGFEAKAQKLAAESAALAATASSGDPKAIGTQFTALIHACTGCHTDFRRGKADRY